jgi:hypothetical protein
LHVQFIGICHRTQIIVYVDNKLRNYRTSTVFTCG